MVSAGPTNGDAVDIYENGAITNIQRYPDQFDAQYANRATSCRLDGDHVILITKGNVFWIQTVSTGAWEIMKS